MGPVRGRLTLAAAVLPTPALAKVCDKVRPDWNGVPSTVWDELQYQIMQPENVFLILLVLALASIPQLWTVFLALVVATLFGFLFIQPDPLFLNDLQWEGYREGCIGDPLLWYAVWVAIGLALIVRLWSTYRTRRC